MEHDIQIVISEENQGKRLDVILASHEAIRTRSQATKLFEKSLVKINGKLAKASTKTSIGDVIEITIPKFQASKLEPKAIPLDIVFEDSDIIVVNKASGIVVHPSHGHEERSLVHALLNHTKDLSMGFNEQRPGIVHRIDKGTSGLLVIAKNNMSHNHLAQQFKDKTTKRNYIAICFGSIKSDSGTITSFLDRHPVDRKKWASNDNEKGREAITHYQVIARYHKDLTLVSLQLETGRTHQIRVHLSELGHPIIGDWTYANKRRIKNIASMVIRKEIENMDRFALHAKSLGFVHPSTGEEMYFETEVPKNLKFFYELFFPNHS